MSETMTSDAEVIPFPKKAKPQPQAESKLPWWNNNAGWILRLAKKHPEIDELLNDHSRLFLNKMLVWRHTPTQNQIAYLDKIDDWVEDTMTALEALEADKPPPPSAA